MSFIQKVNGNEYDLTNLSDLTKLKAKVFDFTNNSVNDRTNFCTTLPEVGYTLPENSTAYYIAKYSQDGLTVPTEDGESSTTISWGSEAITEISYKNKKDNYLFAKAKSCPEFIYSRISEYTSGGTNKYGAAITIPNESENFSCTIALKGTDQYEVTYNGQSSVFDGSAIFICLQAPGGAGARGRAQLTFPTAGNGGGGGGAGGFVLVFVDLRQIGKIEIYRQNTAYRIFWNDNYYFTAYRGNDGELADTGNDWTPTYNFRGLGGDGGGISEGVYQASDFRLLYSVWGGRGGDGGVSTSSVEGDFVLDAKSGATVQKNMPNIPYNTTTSVTVAGGLGGSTCGDDDHGQYSSGGGGAASLFASGGAGGEGLKSSINGPTSGSNGTYGSGGGGGGALGWTIVVAGDTLEGSGGEGGDGFLLTYH